MSEPIPPTTPPSQVPKQAARLMVAILVAMSFLALYANVQKLRHAKIEEIRATPPAASSSAPEAH